MARLIIQLQRALALIALWLINFISMALNAAYWIVRRVFLIIQFAIVLAEVLPAVMAG